MTDANLTDNLALLANTLAQVESLLHSLEQVAGAVGFIIKQSTSFLSKKEPLTAHLIY